FLPDDVDDIRLAINTIHKRSAGLLKFVETYRNLTKTSQPKFERFKVEGFLRELCKLHENDIRENNIELKLDISVPDMEIVADESMMERVIINLLNNAIQAVDGEVKPKIKMRAYFNSTGNVVIQVEDNGLGILPEVIDKIFIPFFTTRQGGSGIGLALSRQLIRAQGGTIGVVSKPGKTIFTIRF
ncbi:MAG: ATP-binding protein, partial [Salinivirgaceae bacterium]|nr:ATP-binding protein [Salinivirgaceae bacterium]